MRARAGSDVRVERVAETLEMDMEAVAYLDDHGIRPGAPCEPGQPVARRHAAGRVGTHTISLSPKLAAEISGVQLG